MTDDSVIEEAMKAVNVAKEAIWRTSPDFDGETNLIAALDKMLDVFEKAHAPTDDEREALATAIRRGSGASRYQSELLADQILPHLRGTEVPTDEREALEAAFKEHESPSWADDPVGRDAAVRWHLRGWTAGLNFARSPRGAGDDREVIAQTVKDVATKFGGPSMAEFANDPPIRKHYATADAILAEGFRRSEVPEPQAEPSDAQVGAAMNAVVTYYEEQGHVTTPESVDFQALRAGLRAAGVVGQTKSTPVDHEH